MHENVHLLKSSLSSRYDAFVQSNFFFELSKLLSVYGYSPCFQVCS